MGLSINDSVYSCLFFFLTGLHFFHLLVGLLLCCCHSSGASFVFLFLFLHLGRAISYGSYFYNPNCWFLWCRSIDLWGITLNGGWFPRLNADPKGWSRKVNDLLSQELYFVLLMKSHLQSYPCPLQINSFWNLGFLLGITIILQIITGIFLGLHYTSDLNSAYSSLFFFIREIFYVAWILIHYLLQL